MRLRYAIGGIAVAALLALPSGAAAKGGGSQVDRAAAQACAQERKDIGRTAFRKKYGEHRTMRACIRRNRSRAWAAINQASQDCQDELDEIGAEAFDDEWESDDGAGDAFTECVSWSVDEILDPSDDVPDDEEDF
jgi:hypothetical protein